LFVNNTQGKNSSIWLELPDIKKFLQQMIDLNKSSAKISSMSPDEFDLLVDSNGHTQVSLINEKSKIETSTNFKFGSFEIQALITCFKQLSS